RRCAAIPRPRPRPVSGWDARRGLRPDFALHARRRPRPRREGPPLRPAVADPRRPLGPYARGTPGGTDPARRLAARPPLPPALLTPPPPPAPVRPPRVA